MILCLFLARKSCNVRLFVWFMALLVGFGVLQSYNEKKLHLTQDKQGTSNN